MTEPVASAPHDDEHTSFDDIRRAAIDAELDVGAEEDTRQKAWHHVLLRIGRMVLGSILILAGVVMLVVPGPGLVAISGGLVILSRDVKWADRALRYLRKKAPGLDEEGPIPKSTIVVSIMLMTAAAIGTYWWFNGGQEWFSGLF